MLVLMVVHGESNNFSCASQDSLKNTAIGYCKYERRVHLMKKGTSEQNVSPEPSELNESLVNNTFTKHFVPIGWFSSVQTSEYVKKK